MDSEARVAISIRSAQAASIDGGGVRPAEAVAPTLPTLSHSLRVRTNILQQVNRSLRVL
jgi:hypothetical protein